MRAAARTDRQAPGEWRRIPYIDLRAQFRKEREGLMAAIEQVLASGCWVGGEAIARFEAAVARRSGVEHAVAVGSGTDALLLGLRALGIGAGDEVITAPNSFISTAAAIVHAGARPVFVDVGEDQNIDPSGIEAAITRATAAILPIHLTGRSADMPAIVEIARRHDLKVVEDAAQAFGATLKGQPAGTFGHLGCFSAHPLKNLNAVGDAGFVLCRDAKLATRLRRLRDHGLVDRDSALEWGVVSRLDNLQAAVLRYRLQRLDAVLRDRRANARRYLELLDDRHVKHPAWREQAIDTYHTFVIQVDRRDELKAHLASRGVASAVHYPVPIHLQPAATELGYKKGAFPAAERQAQRILSLPIHQFLHGDDIEYVCRTINGFYA